MGWLIYGAVVIVISVLIGLHLGRFREAYTEMTGMMAGMTMGMLNGFLLGYTAAAITGSMFWGNLFGMLLGTALGAYYGRAGGLMGIMDGAMGGVMGGSMGAMLLVMLVWPPFIMWTAALLAVVYIAGMAGLVALIEKSAPEHAAFHKVLPMFARAVSNEVREQSARTASGPAYFDDYYTFLGVDRDATPDEITNAYLEQLSLADEATVARAERAYSILTDPVRRRAYNTRLDSHIAAGDCCPPGQKKPVTRAAASASTPAEKAPAAVAAEVPARRKATAQVQAQTPVTTAAQSRQPQKASARKHQAQGKNRARTPQREAPISWVGGVAALVTATVVLIYWLAGMGSTPVSSGAQSGFANNAFTASGRALPAEFVKQLEAQAVPAQVSADGTTQTLDMAVNGDVMSYNPKVIRIKKGVPTNINLSVQGRDPGCGRYVAIEGMGAHGIATPGQVSQMSFTPQEEGVFQINCNMQMMDPGYVIVAQ
ncbi:MAG TPA: cupredoxin domain-containing protein [Chloroflexia bacterium]|nr:cupredoxin domain-containing protein [Chloroflexia bacterium]